MQRFIFFLMVLVIAVVIGLWIAKDPGLALFTYGPWSVEMPLWFFGAGCFVIFSLIYFIVRFFGGIDHMLYRWRNWLRLRRKYHAYTLTNRGLIELIEGDWKRAEHYLAEGLPQSNAPLINYLALAKAAQEQKAYDRRDFYLRKADAEARGRHADLAIGLTRAQLQLQQGQLEPALATLVRLKTVAPRHPQVLKALERVYVHLGDWQNVLRLAPQLAKARVIPVTEREQLEKRAYIELLQSAMNVGRLNALWESVPRKFKKAPGLVYVYAQQLLKYPGQEDGIEALVRNTLKKHWDVRLVELYGKLSPSDPRKQLLQAETWLKRYPTDAALLRALGRCCVRGKLWGKARAYFEGSLKCEADVGTFTEYGKLLEYLGDSGMAMQCYRDGLKLSKALST